MEFTDDVLSVLTDISKRKLRWAILAIDENDDSKVSVEASGEYTKDDCAGDFEKFNAAIPTDKCRWLIFDLEFMLNDVAVSKCVLAKYILMDSKQKEKFPYAQHTDALKAKMPHCAKLLMEDDKADIKFDRWCGEF